MIRKLIIILLINFGGLALGGLWTSQGVNGDWYLGLNKAPWTPPGWFFGVAWFTIMTCYSIYIAYIWQELGIKKDWMTLFIISVLLNVGWNPAFFVYQQVTLGLVIISSLTLIICYLCYKYCHISKKKSLLLLPYILWIIVATSLNAYILMYN